MGSRDPLPVDINENFDFTAVTCIRLLAPKPDAQKFSASQQERLLRNALINDPFLMALLEQPKWQAAIRSAKVPPCQDQHENVTQTVGFTVKSGDIINLSYYGFPHKVVVESCQYDSETNELSLKTIHYGREGLTCPITVMRENFKLSCNGSSMWLHKFPNSICYQPAETLARAVSRLGERQQNPYWNNASTMALWCRVRDHHQNKDDLKVPLFGDNGQVLHELKPGDHVLVSLLGSQLHAVLVSAEGLDDNGDAKLLTAVALVEELKKLSDDRKGMRAFLTGTMPLQTDRRLEVIEVKFPVEEVRKNAKKYSGVSLCWECTEMQAIAFLASGSTSVQQVSAGRFTIDVSEIRAGYAICQDGRFHFVLGVSRPARADQTYSIETVQYAPLQLADAPKTIELRLIVSVKNRKQVQLLRHNEPDLNCAILRAWKFADSPPVKEIRVAVDQVLNLQPGEPVSIHRNIPDFSFSSEMPGLHAIVASVEDGSPENGGPIIKAICYTGDAPLKVRVKEFSCQDYSFSKLQYEVSPSQLASNEEALVRAQSRLDTGQYCCSWSNSRDLARWCCVNHKANAPSYLRPVQTAAELESLPPEGCQLRFQQLSGNRGAQEGQVVRVTSSERIIDVEELLKLSLSDIGWKPSLVHKVSIEDGKGLSRIRHSGESVDETVAQRRQEVIAKLLNSSLINASDGKLGSGVTSREFCNWLFKGPSLKDLPHLMSGAPASNSQLDCDLVTDLNMLMPWDHVVYESLMGTQHLLVVQVEPTVGSLCAYTYGPVAQPTKELTAFVHFPADRSPYRMHTIVRRAAGDHQDDSSRLSSALSTASSYPYDAAAWAQMTLMELESDLLLPQCLLTSLLKSMIRFAFCVATKEFDNDGKLEACMFMLKSTVFADELNKKSASVEIKRRLLFIVQIIASLIGADNTGF